VQWHSGKGAAATASPKFLHVEKNCSKMLFQKYKIWGWKSSIFGKN